MARHYIDPTETLERQNAKLRKITDVLMRRVERSTDENGAEFAHFQAAIVLESQVRARTRDLGNALDDLNAANAALTAAKAEAEQARSDLANALEAIEEGFALFDADETMVMRNSRFCAFLPDVVDRLEPGMSFRDYVDHVSTSRELVLRENAQLAEWRRNRLAAHDLHHVNLTIELRGDRWVQISEQRTPDQGTAILQTDVTDMMRLERMERDKVLDNQARMIRATLDHINQGVAIFDAEGLLVGANERFRVMLAPPLRHLRTGTAFETLARYFAKNATFVDNAALGQLTEWTGLALRPPLTIAVRTRDGRFLDLFGQETPDKGFVISFTDVTSEQSAIQAMHAINETLEMRVADRTLELQAARDMAEQANASKTRFLAAVTHDLLQPLNAAKLFIASLGPTNTTPAQSMIIRRIENAFGSVETILASLLDISKLDSGNPTLNVVEFPISRLFTTLADEFAPIAQEKAVDLRFVSSSAVVTSDYAYLRRILQNLIGNALRYTQKGRVVVGVRRRGADAVVEVWDTGPGIPKERSKEIFEEFKRLNATAGEAPGMGLGLAIVERACAHLGHALSFDSIEGKGTVFRVGLPRSAVSGIAGGDAPLQRVESSARLSGLIALIIENDADVRQGMAQLLEGWGADSLEASSGTEANNLIGEIGIAPDVILADYRLSEGDNGLDAIAVLRATHGNIPAVLITADRDASVADRAKEEDVVFLPKPVEPHRLRSILNWVQSRGQTSDDDSLLPHV